MNEQTELRLHNLIENKERVKNVFAWDGGLIHLACAGIYTAKDQLVDEEKLKYCKDLLKQRVGAFSSFRGTARSPIATMLAIRENPQQTLEDALNIYELLKKNFWGSTYLPLVAMIIAQLAQPYDYERVSIRTRAIYDQMKAEHPFLTSSEDSAFCALMALSDRSDRVLIQDAEACYQMLRESFFSANSVQSLSHVLALCEGDPRMKCQRTMEIFERLKEAGYKYGTGYELPTLGILAMATEGTQAIITDMMEMDDWLAAQKGFGFFSSITRKQRLMYVGILAQKEYLQEETMQTAALNGTISLIVAQEAAMCAAIAASSAAAASSSSSN